jgi:hypothetical protein
MTETISPDLFLDRLWAFQETAALKAALRLGVFDALEPGPASAEAVAGAAAIAPKGARVLCDFLTIKGFLTKADGLYALTGSSRVFLTRASPASLAGVVEFLAGDFQIQQYVDHPEDMVRQGGAVRQLALVPDHPMWVDFARHMGAFMAPMADAVAAQVAAWGEAPARVLDIAAGHGRFGLALAALSPDTHVTALDWAPVVAVAQEHADAAAIGERFATIPGDAFQVDWGAGYDIVLLPNFLHHFNRAMATEILVKARASLAPGGKVLVVEFVPNDDRISPPAAARFAYTMLGSTPEGDAYTAAEYAAMGEDAGLPRMTVTPLPPTPQTLLTFTA